MSKHQSRVVWFVTWVLTLSLVGGCSCWQDPLGKKAQNNTETKRPETLEEMEARRKELQEKKEEKADFETIRLSVLPSDDAPTKNQVKPGHWFSAVQSMKANNFDFPKGDLQAQCVDTRGEPIPLPGTQFDLSTARPVSLPKGQTKHFDLLLFANMPPKKSAINFITKLRPRGGGREVDWKYEATTRMKPFQNHFIVLADLPDNYQFVKALRSVKPERSSDEFLSAELDYFVKLPKGTRRVDVPSHPLTWSNVAYVLWDDFEPEILNADQQQAMLDWLNWGGQLIINGPRTLDRLNASIYGPYLPARAGKVGAVSDAQIKVLNDGWSFGDVGANNLSVSDEKDRPVSIGLELADGAEFVPGSAELVAEKKIGRGRIVTTAFNIPHSFFQKWDSYDSFFNACLLGRPARHFSRTRGSGSVVESWVGSTLTRDDPRVTSSVRYFSRDAMALTTRSKRLNSRKENNEYNRATRRRDTVATMPRVASVAAQSASVSNIIPVVRINETEGGLGNSSMKISIEGSDVLRGNEEERYLITFANVGNDHLQNAQIRFRGNADLVPVEATGGHSTTDRQVLTWYIENIPPYYGNTLEVVVQANSSTTKKLSDISAEFSSNYGKESAQIEVEISEASEVRHPLARAASQAFGVHGFAKDDLIGVAGWSDQSDVSQAARDSLQKAAGISVPSIDFIAKVLGVYLLILVPLNWLLFRLMGRVEWAWAAVPLIAIGGALGVVKAAELDIGFARSRTEISIIETQPGYDRAHVTRYIGFYTSLTSNYEVGGDSNSTLIQPFASSQPIGDRRVAMYQGEKVRLSGFSIISNSTGLVHSEQMLKLGGGISMTGEAGRTVLKNDTDYDLRGAAVVRRGEDDDIEVAWVGELKTKEKKVDITFELLKSTDVQFEEWESLPATSRNSVEGELNIRRLMEIATDPRRLGRGESVLVGWNDQVIDGVTVKPAAAQVTARTLFVAQLSHARRPSARRDTNSYAVMKRELDADKESNNSQNFNF